MFGEVNPGLVDKVMEGARVNDVVKKAGGFTDKADKLSVNIARLVKDGEHILIPSINSKRSR